MPNSPKRNRCPAYSNMRDKWELIEDLLGGTITMRAAKEKWLPKENKEKLRDYENRVKRSILYEGLKDTIEKIAAKPFTRPITIKGEQHLQEQLLLTLKNTDRKNKNINEFASEVYKEALKWGIVHVLVDYPAEPVNNLQQEREKKLAPYFVIINPNNLLDWDTYLDESGVERISMVRIEESKYELVNGIKEEVFYVLEYGRDTWTRYKSVDGVDIVESTGINPTGEVPLETFYTKQTGFLQADPALEGLAWLNLAHWQSSSDQRNLLRVARVPILFLKGVGEEEYKDGVAIGSNAFVRLTSTDSDMKYVEHSGKAIAAGERDITRLEAQMQVLGLQPLMESTGNSTATGRALDESTTHSKAQTWAKELAFFLRRCMVRAGRWVKQPEIDPEFKFEIFTDFAISMKAGLDLQTLLAARQANQISQATLLKEFKRRGILTEDLVVTDEIKITKEDPIAAPAVGNAPKTTEKDITSNQNHG